MPALQLGPRPEDFIWASGIEDTFIPQARPGHRSLDEYELIGHYEHWRTDLALAPRAGLRALRWGVPWYRVEPRQGEFDWRWTDAVLPHMVEELGVTPIIDLMHYGCPRWLRGEFASDDYPRAVAAYAAAFARRYRHLVRCYTPLNEPLVNALMCGRRGLWPPYLRGDAGYIRVMLQLVRGIIRTVAALRQIDPGALLVHVEAAGLSRAASAELDPLAAEERERGFLSYDLLAGRVTPEHPLFTWLLRGGARPADLAALARDPLALDLLGLNFYPQWSTRQIAIDRRGQVVFRTADRAGAGFADLIAAYHRRYRAPIMITETSARGAPALRARWLAASVAAIRRLRAQGVPLLGYTWFPLFTMIDWRYRRGRAPLDHYRLELGLFTLDPSAPDGRWRATELVDQLRGYLADPQRAIGTLLSDG